jgi:hypothetical protein
VLRTPPAPASCAAAIVPGASDTDDSAGKLVTGGAVGVGCGVPLASGVGSVAVDDAAEFVGVALAAAVGEGAFVVGVAEAVGTGVAVGTSVGDGDATTDAVA